MIETLFQAISHAVSAFLSGAARLNMTHWSIISVALIVIGAFCMRGFGSRNKY